MQQDLLGVSDLSRPVVTRSVTIGATVSHDWIIGNEGRSFGRGRGCLPSSRHLVTRGMISGLATASLKLKSIIFGLDSKPGNGIRDFQLLYNLLSFYLQFLMVYL